MKAIWWAFALTLMSQTAFAESVDVLLMRMKNIQSDPVTEAKAVQKGRERGAFCFNCHGKDGNSTRTHIPNLAGQNAAYLFTQFEKFANGKRSDYVMSQLAKKLTDEERINIAIYFSKTEVKPRQQSVSPSQNGKATYDSLCFACHGASAHGSQQYPRIAGQPYEYLEQTLLKFKQKDPERLESPMIGVVQNLSEQQLKDVASYIANMR
ncbi:MAG: c-type cytochrome [Oceanobacter sp.]